MSKYLLSTAALVASVAAHGYVSNATIGGVSYEFYQPYTDPYTSPLPDRVSRPIQGNGPVEDLSISDLQCGGYSAGGINGSSPAALHAAATAGSDVTLFWTLWPDSHMGPTITYMAKCPDTGCNDYMPGSDAVWFKVQEDGRDGTTDTWAVTPLKTAPNAGVTYTIPECIEPGYYLVRHEIIALHAAYSYPGAQFYPGCHQLEITGSGSTAPSGLVSFPGAYAGTDAGITYDAYKATEYTIPGPALFSCSGSTSGSTSGSASTTAAASSTLATATKASSTAAASSSSALAVVKAAATTTSSTAPEATDDTCEEEPTATATGSASISTNASSGSADDENCDAEEEAAYVSRRFHGRYARGF